MVWVKTNPRTRVPTASESRDNDVWVDTGQRVVDEDEDEDEDEEQGQAGQGGWLPYALLCTRAAWGRKAPCVEGGVAAAVWGWVVVVRLLASGRICPNVLDARCQPIKGPEAGNCLAICWRGEAESVEERQP